MAEIRADVESRQTRHFEGEELTKRPVGLEAKKILSRGVKRVELLQVIVRVANINFKILPVYP